MPSPLTSVRAARLLSGVFVWLLAGVVLAASPAALLAPVPSAKVAGAVTKRQQDDPTVRRFRMVEVNVDALDHRGTKSTNAVSVDLFDGRTIVLDKSRVDARNGTSFTWYGHVRGFAKAHAILTVVDGYLTGHIMLLDDKLSSSGNYQIHATGEGVYVLREVDYGGRDEEPAHRHAPPDIAATKADGAQADPASTIDVMIVYSNQTAAAAGASIGSQAQAAVDNTNQIYANSGVSQRLRLVTYQQLAYDEHASSGSDVFNTALEDMTYGSSTLGGLGAVRNSYGADLVAMLVENGMYCGIAWVGPYASYGFSVINRGCATGNSSFAHELGHNMGALHDPYMDPGITPFSYGHGYVSLAGRFRTVMAYDNQCNANGFSCARVPYFSNPNLTSGGLPLGTQQSDPAPTSNVARVLNETAPNVANFRQSVTGCTYAATPASASPGAAGGSGSVAVTAGASCAWTAASNAGWLTITSGASGTGNGNVGWSAAANSGSARSGTATIAGQTFTVNQASGCSYALGAAGISAGAGGAAGSVSVTAGSGCGWGASSNAAWLTVTGGASGTGSGTVSYSVAANTGGARSGTFTIAGQAFTVTQAASASVALGSGTMDFGEQNAGTVGSPLTVTLTNTGTSTLSISALTAGGATPARFTRGGTCSIGTSLSSGQACSIAYTFAAPSSPGASSATLSIVTSVGTSTLNLAGASVPFSLIVHFYQSALHRAPYGGTAYWVGEVSRLQGLGVDPQEIYLAIAQLFFTGAEYKARNASDDQFVNDLYMVFANRVPEPAGYSYWMNLVSSGMPRDAVVHAMRFATADAFIRSVTGAGASRAEVYVLMDLYVGVMGRLPETSGFNYWIAPMRSAQCAGASAWNGEMSALNAASQAFIGSAEYVARNRSDADFVSDLYYALLRRDAGSGGIAYWAGVLGAGQTREQVRQGFFASPETALWGTMLATQGCQ